MAEASVHAHSSLDQLLVYRESPASKYTGQIDSGTYHSDSWDRGNRRSECIKLQIFISELFHLAHAGPVQVETGLQSGTSKPKPASQAAKSERQVAIQTNTNVTGAFPNCFPALGFRMPKHLPSTVDRWWCPYETEYAFVGFSYEVTAC